jgi:hypothetical protein
MNEETESAGHKARPAFHGLDRRTRAFAAEVYEAVHSRELAQPFSAEAVKRCCPGYMEGTYRNFFKKHCVGNPSRMVELFARRCANRFEIVELDRDTTRLPEAEANCGVGPNSEGSKAFRN